MKRAIINIVFAVAVAACFANAIADSKPADIAGDKPVKTLLVVQNHVSDDFKKPLSDIGDRLDAALSGELFGIIDPNNNVGENLNRSPWGEDLPETSATHLAENLGAKALITASVGEASVSNIGNPMVAQQVRMTLTLSAKWIPSGMGFAAVTVTEKTVPMTPEVLAGSTESVYSDLVGKLIAKASSQFLGKAAKAVRLTDEPEEITVFFGCNVLGADVQVDGLSLGTCPGQFLVSPGVHSVIVSYSPYYNDFRRNAKFSQDGQTYAVALQINPAGEAQRMRTLEYEREKVDLEYWKRERESDIESKGVDVEKKKRELDFEFEKKKKDLERELAEGSELFKKQLELADAMLDRYKLSGEADDYVRKTIADGTSIYWKNSYGQIAITDGEAKNIEFATPKTDIGPISPLATTNTTDLAESLRELLMGRTGK